MARKPKAPEDLSKEELDRQVDESIDESFPASDPPSIGHPERVAPKGRRVGRKPAKVILPQKEDDAGEG